MQSGAHDAAGNQVEKDRQVVGCRVPPYVGVTPDASHAEPLEGEVVELAEHTAIDQPLHLADEWIVEERLVDEQQPSAGPCGLHELAALGGGERQRLLHPDVLPRPQGGEREDVMARGRRGEDDRVHGGGGEHLRVVGDAARPGVRFAGTGELLLFLVAEGSDPGSRGLAEGAEEIGAPVPETDECDVHGRRAHQSTARTRKTPTSCAHRERRTL